MPLRALVVASAIVAGCAGDEIGATKCSDPLGGELEGVFTPASESPITLDVVDPWPTVTHVEATANRPSATYLALASNGVYFDVAVSGAALDTMAYFDMTYVGEGRVAFINSCPPLTPGELRRVTGTVTMTFNGERIDGWFNARFETLEGQ